MAMGKCGNGAFSNGGASDDGAPVRIDGMAPSAKGAAIVHDRNGTMFDPIYPIA
jgi:hypothetical protein